MLAGRKLLLADDSITIQKVVALTFADEGIEVLAVSNGAEAIEKLEDFWPDVVLADVYMPRMTGVQVCEYIKRSEKLKHIPVMLLVGSFEPFDEAEARRVGADDTLTKPFQSIRTLVEKVGALLGREPAAEKSESASVPSEPAPQFEAEHPSPPAPPAESHVEPVEPAPQVAQAESAAGLDGAETLELPGAKTIHVPEKKLDSAALELTTADTIPLPPEIRAPVAPVTESHATETVAEEGNMQTELTGKASHEPEGLDDTLLDLADFGPEEPLESDEVVLDIEFETPEVVYAAPAEGWPSAVAVEHQVGASPIVEDSVWTKPADEVVEWEGEIHTTNQSWGSTTPLHELASSDRKPGEGARDSAATAAPEGRAPELGHSGALEQTARAAAQASFNGQITLDQLAPEVIDAIARRAVEMLSEKVVQEIAWEVVPQLAELLIKRKLDESK